MARPFQFFSLYDFFSVFLPGLATLLGFYALLPRQLSVGPVLAFVPTVVLSFVLGQALHSLSAGLEEVLGRTPLTVSHRTRFAERVETLRDTHLGDRFREECATVLRDPSVLSADPDWESLYPLVQSHVYSREGGRSQTFQAIFAFSRSMLVLLAGLPVVYLVHAVLLDAGLVVVGPPKYTLLFDSFRAFLEAAWPLSWLGAVLFLYTARSYERYFVEYLVADFVALRGEE